MGTFGTLEALAPPPFAPRDPGVGDDDDDCDGDGDHDNVIMLVPRKMNSSKKA